MRFKVSALVAALLAGCGGGGTDHHWRDFSADDIPVAQSGLSLWSGAGANQLVTVARHGGTFTLFHMDPFSVVQSYSLPLAEVGELILPSQDGQYFIAASSGGYAIVKADGTVNLNPLAMTGSPQALAYSPSAHVAVLTDDEQSMVLLHLDATGGVVGSWKTDTKFPNGQWAISGAMLADGTYAAGLSGATISIVDVAASVTAQAFKVRSFDVASATDMSWMAIVPGLGFNAVLIQDGIRLVVVNTDKGIVVDQKNMGSATMLGWFTDLAPHVISQTQDEMAAQKNDVSFVATSGKLTSVTFQGSSELIGASLLDPAGGTLALAYDRNEQVNSGLDPYSSLDASQRIVARFTTKDGVALDTSAREGRAHVSLRANFIFASYASSLGLTERLTYGANPQTDTLSRYAFPAISRRFRQ